MALGGFSDQLNELKDKIKKQNSNANNANDGRDPTDNQRSNGDGSNSESTPEDTDVTSDRPLGRRTSSTSKRPADTTGQQPYSHVSKGKGKKRDRDSDDQSDSFDTQSQHSDKVRRTNSGRVSVFENANSGRSDRSHGSSSKSELLKGVQNMDLPSSGSSTASNGATEGHQRQGSLLQQAIQNAMHQNQASSSQSGEVAPSSSIAPSQSNSGPQSGSASDHDVKMGSHETSYVMPNSAASPGAPSDPMSGVNNQGPPQGSAAASNAASSNGGSRKSGLAHLDKPHLPALNSKQIRPGHIIVAPHHVTALNPNADPETDDDYVWSQCALICSKRRFMVVLWTHDESLFALPTSTHSGRGLSTVPGDLKEYVEMRHYKDKNFRQEGPNKPLIVSEKYDPGEETKNGSLKLTDGVVVNFAEDIQIKATLNDDSTSRLQQMWLTTARAAIDRHWRNWNRNYL